MIICFEGAPAVGKSTLADKLSKKYLVVPEVNELFGKENRISNSWYYERQIDRWNLATTNTQEKPSILDGDVFQPVWFNWIYPNRISGTFDEIIEFYRKKIILSEIRFPDIYVVFSIDEKERESREVYRSQKVGKSQKQIAEKVSRYKDFAAAQNVYFDQLSKVSEGLVHFVEAKSNDACLNEVKNLKRSSIANDKEIYEYMADWCKKNPSGTKC